MSVENKEHTCSFNSGVGCDVTCRRCNACGWNPDVSAKRLTKWQMRRRLMGRR